MGWLDVSSYSIGLNFFIFAIGAAVVWGSGTRLSRYVDAIAKRTGVGEIFLGMLLLGGITSLPELATTLTASMTGNAPLAVNNILGGVAMQTAILALADFAVRGRALTAVAGRPALLLQGLLLIVALAFTGVGMAVGDVTMFGGITVWTSVILALVLFGLYLIQRYESSPRWETAVDVAPLKDREVSEKKQRQRRRLEGLPVSRLALYTTVAGLAIIAGGFAVARSGDVLAEQTGLGDSFMGAVAVAIATSLPEVSTTLEAVRLGQPRLALSNIFGANLFDVGLLFFADLTYSPGPVLDEMGVFSMAAAFLGIVLTAVYLIGIVERQDRTALRMGYDSLLVLVLYAGGVVLLYTLR